MSITSAEFEEMMADESKSIDEDLRWIADEDHSPALEFRARVASQSDYPLVVKGWLNRLSGKLSFTLIHGGAGRVYALDLGADHHNPTCETIGEKHKHRWTSNFGDKEAYVPADVTAPIDRPAEVWRQFCTEAKIVHKGNLDPPPSAQEELPL